MRTNLLLKLLLLFLIFNFVGCVSIPPEAPELSAKLGNRISAIEVANVTLLNKYFDQKRKEIDRFITGEWLPLFAKNFFKREKIKKAWDIIVKEDDASERLKFIILIGPKLQEMINKKRKELIKPLEDLERHIEKSIRDEYNQVRAINNSITSFLLSASKVAENRNRYLEMAGITDEKIGKIIDKTDDVISDFLEKSKVMDENINKAQVYIDKIKEIRNSIKNKEN